MRILYIVTRWPNLYTTYIFSEAAWMKRRGHHVAVASLERDATGGEVHVRGFGLEDVPVLQLDHARGPQERVVEEAAAFARAERIEIVDAHMARAEAELARRLRVEAAIPYAIRMHGGDVHSNPAANLAELIAGASVVCPVSQFLADVLLGERRVDPTPRVLPIAVPHDKLRVLPNGLPASWVAPAPARQRDDVMIVGSSGRLTPIKAHHDLIDAVARLSGELPGLRLTIIGGGALRDALLEQAAALGVRERVEITGPRPWSEVMRHLDELHVYVQASRLEGFCLATIEGAARGLPVVASRTGIHEQCVDVGKNGYLFDAGDVPTLCAHLRALFEAGAEERRRMGAASIAVVRERFLLEGLLPRVEAIYRAVIDGAPLPP